MDAPRGTGRDVRPDDAQLARARVEEFLRSTKELPADGDPNTSLIRHDGHRTWSSDDLETVTTSEAADPTWLRLQAAINAHRQERDQRQS
jgi:hypothetical protein